MAQDALPLDIVVEPASRPRPRQRLVGELDHPVVAGDEAGTEPDQTVSRGGCRVPVVAGACPDGHLIEVGQTNVDAMAGRG